MFTTAIYVVLQFHLQSFFRCLGLPSSEKIQTSSQVFAGKTDTCEAMRITTLHDINTERETEKSPQTATHITTKVQSL